MQPSHSDFTLAEQNSSLSVLTLANGYCDQSSPIPHDVKSEISHWLKVLNQWNGKEISQFSNLPLCFHNICFRIRSMYNSQETWYSKFALSSGKQLNRTYCVIQLVV
ncbi:hypothetical protein ACTFIW_003900 [Dictyostelium discoideum]